MSKPHDACPHCGKHLAPKPAGFPVYLAVSLLALAASVFFWRESGKGAAAAPQPAPPRGLNEEKIAFIVSPAGAAACGGCLGSADEFLLQKRLTTLKTRTAGMALIPGGEYQVGSPEGAGDPDEHPLHTVRLSAFYVDAREATMADYFKFAEETQANFPEWAKPGSKFSVQAGTATHYKRDEGLMAACPNCPVMGVTVKDAAAYCARLGKRLPTEAEWETAARAGSGSAYSFGDSAAGLGGYAWYEGNSGGLPHPVGALKPNAFGLYDMHGNVWEWTSDFYGKGYYAASERIAPAGPATGRENSIRGGSWDFDADSLRSGNRASSSRANDDIGFRCAAGKAEMERLAEEDAAGKTR
ncbi:MAG: formylglycine-generating enzyme family protein [Elusimicrobia bacterium]|nr:formylglycine-generating enzyme family protein [Elusimicrobiota bacterium]